MVAVKKRHFLRNFVLVRMYFLFLRSVLVGLSVGMEAAFTDVRSYDLV